MSNNQLGLEDLKREINQAHEDVQAAVRRALDAGRYLIQAQEQVRAELGHGKWMRWVAENCNFSDRTARMYMRMVDLLDDMPDVKDQLVEASLRMAHDILEGEHKSRFPDRHIDLHAVETDIREGVDKVQRALDLVFRKLGKERGGAWLADLGIDPAEAEGFIRATARWHLGVLNSGETPPPLVLPPAPTKSQRGQNGNALPISPPPPRSAARANGANGATVKTNGAPAPNGDGSARPRREREP